jgi:geranylgeranyl diphosphate synthase, type II
MSSHETVTPFAALEADLEDKRGRIETALRRLVRAGEPGPVADALTEGLLAPGKRLRPILVLMVAELLGGSAEAVLPAACAVEMVHAASLILDDLPCMDHATVRRGRPALHLAHGEANAVLAAFALLNRAFEVLAEGWAGGPDPATRAQMTRALAGAVGLSGMIAGQAHDLALRGRPRDAATVAFVDSRKTGALFVAGAALGARAAGATAGETEAVVTYAESLGLAFQVVDDVIDAPGAPGGRARARELIAAGQAALAPFGPRARPLGDLARYIATRRK